MTDQVARPQSGEWRDGWPVVLASAAMAGVGAGLYQNLSSLFMPGIRDITGASRSEIGASAALGLLGALAAPYIGRLADRIGVVPVIVVSALGLAATYVWLSLMSGGLWQFQIGVAFLALTAPGMSTMIYGRLVATRFDRHRGLALAFATSGLSLTTVLLPAAIGWIIETWGLAAAYHVLAALAVIVGIPAGLYATRKAGVLERPTRQGRSARPPSWRNLLFWRICGATMLINVGTVGMVTSLALIGGERGLGLAAAGLLLSAYGASQIVGRIGMGALIDRYPANRIAAGFGMISTAGFVGMIIGPSRREIVGDELLTLEAIEHFMGMIHKSFCLWLIQTIAHVMTQVRQRCFARVSKAGGSGVTIARNPNHTRRVGRRSAEQGLFLHHQDVEALQTGR